MGNVFDQSNDLKKITNDLKNNKDESLEKIDEAILWLGIVEIQANELEKLSNYFDDLNQLKAQAHPEQLIIEAAFLDYVAEDMTKNQFPSISIKLVGVHLGKRSWPGMKIKLGLSRKLNYSHVEFLENSCSPACISNFNEGWDSDWHGIRGFNVAPFNGEPILPFIIS